MSVYRTYAHPGARLGEVFFGIMSPEFFRDRCGWTTRRLGEPPSYMQDGRVVQGCPVFVQESEMEESGYEVRIEPMKVQPDREAETECKCGCKTGCRRNKYEAVKV